MLTEQNSSASKTITEILIRDTSAALGSTLTKEAPPRGNSVKK
jgi:hypothetical protein